MTATHARPTGSALERLWHCPVSATLPQTDSTSEPAIAGTIGHAFLAAVRDDREAALDEIDDPILRVLCEELPIDELPASEEHAVFELAFAYDVKTMKCRELSRGMEGRDYKNLGSNEIPGTADVAILANGFVYVCDYKFGWTDKTPARKHRQGRFYAMAVATLWGQLEARLQIIRPREGGKAFPSSATFDAFELDDIRDEVRETHLRVILAADAVATGSEPIVHEGPWCRFCPAFNNCPAKISLTTRMVHDPESILGQLIPLTSETAPIALEKLQAMEALVKRIKTHVYDFAKRESIALPDGTMLGYFKKKKNDKVDGDIAWEVMKELYGLEVADEAVERKGSKKRIRDAIRKVKLPVEKLATIEKHVLAKIRAAGGIESGSAMSLGFHEPDKKA